MIIRRIVPNINSTKLDESKKFYNEFLGMKLVMDMEWILTFISDSNPTAQISIVKVDNSNNSNMSISIEVSDIDAFYDSAKLFGYEIVHDITNEPWGVKRFCIKDPNEVTINAMTHIK
jgi:predicted enzyme related to lactoylglutathione lyase